VFQAGSAWTLIERALDRILDACIDLILNSAIFGKAASHRQLPLVKISRNYLILLFFAHVIASQADQAPTATRLIL
jgi:hypothetical protein